MYFEIDRKPDRTLRVYSQTLIFLSLIGLGLSLYAYIIELRLQQNEHYKPLCDLTADISCTKTIRSKYGKGLGIFNDNSILYIPNSFFGIVFYSMLATLNLSHSTIAVHVSLALIMLSSFTSLYFAYILYFILVDICLICISIYLVNAISLIVIIKLYNRSKQIDNEYDIQTFRKIQ